MFLFWLSFTYESWQELAFVREAKTTSAKLSNIHIVDDENVDIGTYTFYIPDFGINKTYVKVPSGDLEPTIKVEYIPGSFQYRHKGEGYQTFTEWLLKRGILNFVLLISFLSIGVVYLYGIIQSYRYERIRCQIRRDRMYLKDFSANYAQVKAAEYMKKLRKLYGCYFEEKIDYYVRDALIEFLSKAETNSQNEQVSQSIYQPKKVRKKKGYSTGTGFFINEEGFLITSYRVIEEASEITIKTNKGEEYIAEYLAHDFSNDTALLKAETKSIPLKFNSPYSRLASKGDKVLTLGYPFVQIEKQTLKSDFGQICENFITRYNCHFTANYAIDLPLEHGNSGGPLLNENGNVIGIVSKTLEPINNSEDKYQKPSHINYAHVACVMKHILLEDIKFFENPQNESEESEKSNQPNLLENISESIVQVIAR